MILNSSSLATTSSFNNKVKVLLLLSPFVFAFDSKPANWRWLWHWVFLDFISRNWLFGSTPTSPHRCLSSIRLHLQKVTNLTCSQCMGPVSPSSMYQVDRLNAKLSTISTVWKPRWVMKVCHLLPLSHITPYLLLPVNKCIEEIRSCSSNPSPPPLNSPSLPSIPRSLVWPR